MQGSDISTESLRRLNVSQRQAQLKEANGRPIVKRLWETYAADLTETLDAYNAGEIDQKLLHRQMRSLVKAMDNLRDDGRLAEALERAQVILIDRVLEGIEN